MERLLTVLMALLISVTAAVAAPVPPVFDKPVTVGEGDVGRRLNKRLAVSGATVYVGHTSGDGVLQVIKSENGGKAWGKPIALPVAGADSAPDVATLRLALSDDPQAKGKKILHAAWHVPNPNRAYVYYAYLSERGKKPAWSKPVKLDLGPQTDSIGSGGTSMIVSESGAIHILHNVRYVTADSFSSTFSEPMSLPEPAYGPTYLSIDGEKNLYATYVDENRKLKMARKSAAAAAWSAPLTIHEATLGDLSNDISVEILNPTTYYVGVFTGSAGKAEAYLLVTTDGGASWAKRSVFNDVIDWDNCYNLVVSAGKVITFAAEIFDARGKPEIKVWRSNDEGVTWSAPVTVKGERLRNIALDKAGKLNMLVLDETSSRPQNAKLILHKEK